MTGAEQVTTGPWGRVPVEPDHSATPQPPSADENQALANQQRSGQVAFHGKRLPLLAIMVRGYVLTLLTLGIYRFWLLTQKRRFYWSNTVLDGHPLEYTGRSIQLLVGFMLAVLVFIPLYGGIFYLTTVYYEAAALAYLGLFVILYFLAGYAMYRGRRFRLTRTLWRGIRFGQTGNAWNYAIRRFLWTVVTISTLGLTYPFMLAGLYRYRFSNTWFGDRQFTFAGGAGAIAWPFYLAYLVNGGLAIWAGSMIYQQPWTIGEDVLAPSQGSILPIALTGVAMALTIPWFRGVLHTRMLSSIRVGDAQLRVRVRARSLIGQYLAYGVLVGIISFAFLLLLGLLINSAESGALNGLVESVAFLGRGLGTLLLFALAYLTVAATYALLWEVIISFGYWKIVARNTVIENVDSLRTVRARHDESPSIGEGFADALNVGAY